MRKRYAHVSVKSISHIENVFSCYRMCSLTTLTRYAHVSVKRYDRSLLQYDRSLLQYDRSLLQYDSLFCTMIVSFARVSEEERDLFETRMRGISTVREHVLHCERTHCMQQVCMRPVCVVEEAY